MEVLIVHGIDPTITKPGGTRSYILNLIQFLKTNNIKVSLAGVLSKDANLKLEYDFIKIMTTSNISSLKFLIALFFKSIFLKVKEKCIIITNRSDNMIPFIIFHKKNPKICVLHGLDAKKINMKKGKIIGKVYDFIECFSLRNINAVIAVDKRTYDFYANRYPFLKLKMKIIPVGINLEQFKPIDKETCRSKYFFSGEYKIIMYVGRLEKEKNIDFIISSLKYVTHKYIFVIVGDGNEKDGLNALVSSLNLNCHFTGSIPQEQMPEILNCADVLVISSLFESGPLVAQESIACGVPVVSVDVGRIKEYIINDNIGKICNRNIYEFADAINNILYIKDEGLIEYRNKIAAKFSFENTAKMTLEIFNHLEAL